MLPRRHSGGRADQSPQRVCLVLVSDRQPLFTRQHQPSAGGLTVERHGRGRLQYRRARGGPGRFDRVLHQLLGDHARHPQADVHSVAAEDVLEGQVWLADEDSLPSRVKQADQIGPQRFGTGQLRDRRGEDLDAPCPASQSPVT
ncbi:hypothetical protein [Sphaerisporangium sp. TRM90804]|uniref:hypothetical protein n=1 Tax=Sphaerisporangium sp. TRM90804 TaxID=3031113 RepID=UPI0024480408|nr:hypothetical protein [Sphaerisporangium sp. TRM90804]MDH2426470.1 hypothetical protein [Sphaerisporangium sp. TRM90804]